MTFADHLETTIGRIQQGWTPEILELSHSVTVVQLDCVRDLGAIPFATLGMSRYPLRSPVSEKSIRQELLFLADEDMDWATVPGVLGQVAEEALSSGIPYLRGSVLGPWDHIFDGFEQSALYFAVPNVLDTNCHAFCGEEGYPIALCWCVPIFSSEAAFIEANGWPAFEDLLAEQGVDMISLARSPAR